MYNFLSKHSQTLGFGLGLLVVVISLISIFGGLSSFNTMAEEDQFKSSIFNFALYAAIALIIIAAVAALLFGLLQTFSNLKGSLKFLLSLAGVLVVFFIAYSISDADIDSPIGRTIQEFQVSENTSKFVSASIWTSILLAVLTAASFVIFEVLNLFK